MKPELVAPGVGLATSDPGANADGSERFVTPNGSSAAAATVAGAAALLAQARPSLGADALAGLLVGTAEPVPVDRVTAQGAGRVNVGAATAGELAASPAALALGRSSGAGWQARAGFTLTNLSTRTVRITLGVRTQDEGAAQPLAPFGRKKLERRPAAGEACLFEGRQLIHTRCDQQHAAEPPTRHLHHRSDQTRFEQTPLQEGGKQAEPAPDNGVTTREGEELRTRARFAQFPAERGKRKQHRGRRGQHHGDHHDRPHDEDQRHVHRLPRCHARHDHHAGADLHVFHPPREVQHVDPGEAA